MRDHIADACLELPRGSEAEVRTLLERIGDPAEIASEARGRPGVVSSRAGWLEVGALVLLAFGFTVVGWVAGVALLWSSRAWTTREKLIGTLAWPVVFFLGAVATMSVSAAATGGGPDGGLGPVELGSLVAVVAAPIASVIYLAIKLHGRSSTGTPALGGIA